VDFVSQEIDSIGTCVWVRSVGVSCSLVLRTSVLWRRKGLVYMRTHLTHKDALRQLEHFVAYQQWKLGRSERNKTGDYAVLYCYHMAGIFADSMDYLSKILTRMLCFACVRACVVGGAI